MSDPANTFRDATISRATRDALAACEANFSLAFPLSGKQREAIREVVERWDESEATEVVGEEKEQVG